MESPSFNLSSPTLVSSGRTSPTDTLNPSPPTRTTPLPLSEGDAELVLIATHLTETMYGRTLLLPTSSEDDRAAAAARIMGAVLQRHTGDEHCFDAARAIIDHVHGHAVVAEAFREGPLMIFPMGNERESREWERNDNDWERRILQFVSEAKILEMAEIGRGIMEQWGEPEVGLGDGECVGEREQREEDEEQKRFELGRSMYLRMREGEALR